MPRFVKKWFIEKLGKKLLISRKTEKAQYHRTAQHEKQVNALSAMNILEKQFQKTLFDLELATMAKKQPAAPKGVNSLFLELPLLNRSKSVKIRKPSVKAVKKEAEEISPETVQDTDPDREKLRKAERNVHFIAKTLTDERRAQEAEADWQFVSLVIDRILLVFFAITIAVGTILTIFSAPSLYDARKPISKN
uniref:Neur_chan_memb domain-containing protein n=2 Tax=Caenorhabditis japonica TaxID=281687 RepID=A0A8R1DH75_CAEJA